MVAVVSALFLSTGTIEELLELQAMSQELPGLNLLDTANIRRLVFKVAALQNSLTKTLPL